MCTHSCAYITYLCESRYRSTHINISVPSHKHTRTYSIFLPRTVTLHSHSSAPASFTDTFGDAPSSFNVCIVLRCVAGPWFMSLRRSVWVASSLWLWCHPESSVRGQRCGQLRCGRLCLMARPVVCTGVSISLRNVGEISRQHRRL